MNSVNRFELSVKYTREQLNNFSKFQSLIFQNLIWKFIIKKLQLNREKWLYPPRIHFTVNSNSVFIIPIVSLHRSGWLKENRSELLCQTCVKTKNENISFDIFFLCYLLFCTTKFKELLSFTLIIRFIMRVYEYIHKYVRGNIIKKYTAWVPKYTYTSLLSNNQYKVFVQVYYPEK